MQKSGACLRANRSPLFLAALPSQAGCASVVTTPKCGGKSACWDKPGPSSGYRMSSAAAAQAKQAQAVATGGDLYACIEVLVNKHPEEGWCKRAIRDLQAYIRGAKDGVLPGLIASACEKCFKQAIPGVRFGGSHHVMCKRSAKPRQRT